MKLWSRARAQWIVAAVGLGLLLVAGRSNGDGTSARDGEEVSSAGYVEMPASTNGTWTLAAGVGSGRHWARPETVRFLIFLSEEWRRRHPDGPRIHIGDISNPEGSKFPPHKTHRDGLSIDLYTRPKNICSIKYKDQDLTQELAELVKALGARQILYNGTQVAKAVDIAQKYPKHDTHFHIVVKPERVPVDFGPFVMIGSAYRDGAAIGASGFGKRGKKRRKKRKTDEPALQELDDLRLEWGYLGEARGYQKLYRITLRPEGGLSPFDTGWIKKKATWHLIEGTFVHGQKLIWEVYVEGPDGEKQSSGPNAVVIDLAPPVLTNKSPAAGAALSKSEAPKFTWTYQDTVVQREARVEIRKQRARKGLTLDPVLGKGASKTAPSVLPKGKYEWRVVGTDRAGNEGASEWTPFVIE